MKKYISLTFDDGPNINDDRTMENMIDFLYSQNIRATFFLIGNKINEKNSKLIKKAFDQGFEFENHSWSHQKMSQLTEEEIVEEFQKCSQAITKITGKEPLFFRPPFLDTTPLMHRLIPLTFIGGHGCQDWTPKVSAKKRIKCLHDMTKDGSIYLLHVMEGNFKTLQALEKLIPILKEEGYDFVTLEEMFKIKNIPLQAHSGKVWVYYVQ